MSRLMTIGVKCCSQVQYIEAALEAAFSQTYRPLEIVVSDDGSSDGSWELINEIAAKHAGEDGVSVLLNRNETNLGNLGNWMRIGELSHGDWIVKADGDDISEPSRVARIAEEIEKSGGDKYVVLHGATKINPEDREIGGFPVRYASYPLGAVMAFRRECFTAFPKPEKGWLVDDEIFARRALMLGGEINIPERLVRYRVGTGISSGLYDLREPEIRCVRQLPESIAQSVVDLEARRGSMSEEMYVAWKARLERESVNARKYLLLLSGERFSVRWRAWRQMQRPSVLSATYLKFLAYLLPRRFGDKVISLLGKIRYG